MTVWQALQKRGVTALGRKALAGTYLNQEYIECFNAAVQALSNSRYYKLGFDGGRDKYMEDATKFIGVTANLPGGSSLFMGLLDSNGTSVNTLR